MAEEEKGDVEDPKVEVEDSGSEGSSSLSEKYEELTERLNQNEHVQKGKAFVLSHKQETVMAVLLLLALFLTWKVGGPGAAFLGLFSGLSLSKQWLSLWHHGKGYLEVEKGHFKVFAALVTAIGLLMTSTPLVIGTAIGVALKVAWDPKSHSFGGDE